MLGQRVLARPFRSRSVTLERCVGQESRPGESALTPFNLASKLALYAGLNVGSVFLPHGDSRSTRPLRTQVLESEDVSTLTAT